MGFGLYGNDISDTTSLLEAGLDGLPSSIQMILWKEKVLALRSQV